MVSQEIASQQRLLEQIQAANAKKLHDSGIYGRALEVSGIGYDPTVVPVVTERMTPGPGGQDVTHTELVISSFSYGNRGAEKYVNPVTTLRTVKVAESVGGALLAAEGFTDQDATTVRSMVEGLTEARDMGLLPNLDTPLTGISMPNNALRAARHQPKP